MSFERKLAWKPDLDKSWDHFKPGAVSTVQYVNFLEQFPNGFQAEVEDQTIDLRALGGPWVPTSSCAGNSSGAFAEFGWRVTRGQKVNVSRLGIYSLGRKLDGTLNQDQGTYISSCFKQMEKYGVCLESFHPFHPDFLFKDLSPEAYAQAARHKIRNIRRVAREHVIDTLREGRLVVGGFRTYRNIVFQEALTGGGFIRLPTAAEGTTNEGHAILFAGFDLEGRYSKFTKGRPVVFGPNSWGPTWGSNSPIRPGWFMLDLGYILESRLSDDFWTADYEF